MTQRTTFVIPADRFAAVVAAITLSALPAGGKDRGPAPQPTAGETQTPRKDGTTRTRTPRDNDPGSILGTAE